MKEIIYDKAVQLGYLYDDNRFSTPLIIILLTDAVVCGHDVGHITINELIENSINTNKRYWRETICQNDDSLYSSIEKMLVYATATGGWDLKSINEPFKSDSNKLLENYNKDELDSIISGLMEYSTYDKELKPIEPDIIGEYFVLEHLNNNLHWKHHEKIKLLWEKKKQFLNFITRCSYSFLGDYKFYQLINGELSLLNLKYAPLESLSIYLNIINKQPLDIAKTTIQNLEKMSNNNSNNHEVVQVYVDCLFNLMFKQDAVSAADTIERLRRLAEDPRYAGNQDIMNIFKKINDSILSNHDLTFKNKIRLFYINMISKIKNLFNSLYKYNKK